MSISAVSNNASLNTQGLLSNQKSGASQSEQAPSSGGVRGTPQDFASIMLNILQQANPPQGHHHHGGVSQPSAASTANATTSTTTPTTGISTKA